MHGRTPGHREPDARSDVAASTRLFGLLIAISAIGPLSLNILMPAIPRLAVTLGTDTATVQLTLTLYLLGLATSQLVLGPLSDRWGRRPVVLGGLALTVVSSLAASLCSTIDGLIIARSIQALGASSGVAVGRAIIRDLYSRDRAASMIGWVTMVMVVAPMIAPSLGGVMDTMLGWRVIFIFIALVAFVVLIGAAWALPETRPVLRADVAHSLFGSWRDLIREVDFAAYGLCAALSAAMFFAFLGGAPHVVVTIMHRTSAEYGLWFALASIGYMLGNYVSARWSPRHGIDAMILSGIVLGLCGAMAALVLVWLWAGAGPASIFLPQTLISFGSGLLLPCAMAGAISVRPQVAGAASGIVGFLQMGIGALAAQYVGYLLDDAKSAQPMLLVILALGLGSAVAFVTLGQRLKVTFRR